MQKSLWRKKTTTRPYSAPESYNFVATLITHTHTRNVLIKFTCFFFIFVFLACISSTTQHLATRSSSVQALKGFRRARHRRCRFANRSIRAAFFNGLRAERLFLYLGIGGESKLITISQSDIPSRVLAFFCVCVCLLKRCAIRLRVACNHFSFAFAVFTSDQVYVFSAAYNRVFEMERVIYVAW